LLVTAAALRCIDVSCGATFNLLNGVGTSGDTAEKKENGQLPQRGNLPSADIAQSFLLAVTASGCCLFGRLVFIQK
jgi:hypothetical protein